MRIERLGGADADVRLTRALVASARCAGADAIVAEHRSRPWASATFAGARHRLTLTASRGWIEALPGADLVLRGHIVADLAIVSIEGEAPATARLEVLTIEE